jgi:hypothetical protein
MIEEQQNLIISLQEKFESLLYGKLDVVIGEFLKAYDHSLLNPNKTKKIMKCGSYEDADIRITFLQHPMKEEVMTITASIKTKLLF